MGIKGRWARGPGHWGNGSGDERKFPDGRETTHRNEAGLGHSKDGKEGVGNGLNYTTKEGLWPGSWRVESGLKS